MGLKDIRTLIDNTSPGPWQIWITAIPNDGEPHVHAAAPPHRMVEGWEEKVTNDATFVSAARTLLPLLFELAEAQSAKDESQTRVEAIFAEPDSDPTAWYSSWRKKLNKAQVERDEADERIDIAMAAIQGAKL